MFTTVAIALALCNCPQRGIEVRDPELRVILNRSWWQPTHIHPRGVLHSSIGFADYVETDEPPQAAPVPAGPVVFKTEPVKAQPKITIPIKATVAAGELLTIEALTDSPTVQWFVTPGLTITYPLGPDGGLPDPANKKVVCHASEASIYAIIAVVVDGTKAKSAVCVVTVTGPKPPPVAKVIVPNVVGSPFGAAAAAIKNLGLKVAGETQDTTFLVGTQSPIAGTSVDIGSTVTITVVAPVDPFDRAVADAYALTTDAEKPLASAFASVFRQMINKRVDPTTGKEVDSYLDTAATTKDLFVQMLAARRAVIADTQLKAVRLVIDTPILEIAGATSKPLDPPQPMLMTSDLRTALKSQFQKSIDAIAKATAK